MQFMLPKIDVLVQKGELTDVELDVFGEFECKIVEVYYWNKGKGKGKGEGKGKG